MNAAAVVIVAMKVKSAPISIHSGLRILGISLGSSVKMGTQTSGRSAHAPRRHAARITVIGKRYSISVHERPRRPSRSSKRARSSGVGHSQELAYAVGLGSCGTDR